MPGKQAALGHSGLPDPKERNGGMRGLGGKDWILVCKFSLGSALFTSALILS